MSPQTKTSPSLSCYCLMAPVCLYLPNGETSDLFIPKPFHITLCCTQTCESINYSHKSFLSSCSCRLPLIDNIALRHICSDVTGNQLCDNCGFSPQNASSRKCGWTLVNLMNPNLGPFREQQLPFCDLGFAVCYKVLGMMLYFQLIACY